MITKNNSIRILFSLMIFIGFISCNDENEGLFDKSAAERTAENLQEIKTTLRSANDGWIFEYFPHINQDFGGYTFVVKFLDDENVQVFAEAVLQSDPANPAPETSLYDVIAKGGSVLTFNEYNSLMHFFAEPSSALYQARGGDYEFVMSLIDENTLKAKGVFTGNNLRLRKNTEDPATYMAKVDGIVNFVAGKSLFVDAGDGFKVGTITERNLFFDYNSELKQIPFMYTSTGIKFYEAQTINGEEILELTLTGNTLSSAEGKLVIELVGLPLDMTQTWISAARPGFFPQAFIDEFNTAKAIHDANFAAFPLSDIFDIGGSTSSITFGIGGTIARHGLIFSGVLGEPTQMNIIIGAPSTNWQFVPSFNPMVNLIASNAPYEVNQTSATRAEFTSVANPTFAFVLLLP